MVKAWTAKGSSDRSEGTLKTPSATHTSKPDKDPDKQIELKPGSTSERGVLKKNAVRQFLSTKELKALKRAKAEGGAAWEAAKASVRNKMAPAMNKSMSARANTAMPVKRLKVRLQGAVPKDSRVTTEAAVALAAVMDYAVSELIDNACQACELKKSRTITARHIKLGVPQDESLAELFRGVTIPQGGTVPTFHPELAQGYRNRNQKRREDDGPVSKDLSSPSFGVDQDGFGKKGLHTDKKPSSGSENSVDPKKNKPGASSSSDEKMKPGGASSPSPAEK